LSLYAYWDGKVAFGYGVKVKVWLIKMVGRPKGKEFHTGV